MPLWSVRLTHSRLALVLYSSLPEPHSQIQKDNIIFGQPYNEDRYWEAIENASLLPDLQVLPDGDLTEVRTADLDVIRL